jgi:hypothetical protein
LFSPRAVVLHAALGLLAAAVTSILLSLLWDHLGLPDRPQMGAMAAAAKPWGLKRFVCLAGPAAVFLPTLCLACLALLWPGDGQDGRAALAGQSLRLDALTYLGLPGLFVLVAIWRELGNGFAALGLVFLGLVAVKALLLLRLLWEGFLRPAADARPAAGEPAPSVPAAQAVSGWRRNLAVFLVAWTLLGLLAAWDEEAISSASDEVGYLLLTHSLVSRGDFNVFPAMERKEYEAFYWARFSPDLGQSSETAQAWVFPFLIAPAYWLGGRLGVLVFFAGLMALAAVQLLRWLEEAGLKPGSAAAATGLTLGAAPVLFLSQQVYPDVPAMLLLLAGMRLLLALPRRPWACALGLALAVALIGGLKFRLVPLGAGLALMGALELLALRWGWRRALAWAGLGLAALLALILLTPTRWWPGPLAQMWSLAAFQMGRAVSWWQPLTIFFSGLALDQNFGLLLAAPLMLLALAGLPAGLKLWPRPFGHLLAPAALYLGLVCFTRWFQWYAGFSIPGRFVAVLLPLAALPLGLALTALNRPWLRLLLWLPAAWGALYAALASLHPQMRFSRPVGVNPLLETVSAALNLELFHLLPSTFTLSPAMRPWTWALLGTGALLTALVWLRAGRAVAEPPLAAAADGPGREEVSALALLAGLAAVLGVALASLYPPRFLEAEQMQSSGVAAWTEYAYPGMMRGMVLLNGQTLRGRMSFPGGQAGLVLVGRAEETGQLVLRLDQEDRPVAWEAKQKNSQVDLGLVPQGYHQISLTWRSCPERTCSLLLDRLELRPGPASGLP